MGVALLSLSCMAVSMREATRYMGVADALAARCVVGVVGVLFAAILFPSLRGALAPRRLGLHALRNGVHFVGQYAWGLSVSLLPFARVFALEFATPVLTVLFAALLLRERLTMPRLFTVLVGAAGLVVITVPKTGEVDPLMLLPLASSAAFALAGIFTKRLTATVTALSVMFWMNAMQLPLNLAGADWGFWRSVPDAALLPLLGVCVSGSLAQYAMANAFRHGDAMVVVPLDFLRVPLIALVGAVFYGEALEPAVLVGAGIIVAGIVAGLRAEASRQVAVQGAADPAPIR
ncbi:DMT family transporter [Microvirga aerilata]|nr:DMT family transporter [Microvirga aerilata]